MFMALGSMPGLIIKLHSDKVFETRFLFNEFIIHTRNSSASSKVTGSKERDSEDRET